MKKLILIIMIIGGINWVHVLYVNSVLHRLALGDRRLGEILAASEFLQDARIRRSTLSGDRMLDVLKS